MYDIKNLKMNVHELHTAFKVHQTVVEGLTGNEESFISKTMERVQKNTLKGHQTPIGGLRDLEKIDLMSLVRKEAMKPKVTFISPRIPKN